MANPITTMQDQYLAFARQGQEAAAAVVGAWTRSLQDTAIQTPVAAGQAAANTMIDQMFDFAQKMIDVQRNLSKQLVSQSATVVGDVAQQATTVANETTEKVAKAARRTTKSA
jgi:uncharacterized protein YgiB involved in biofilm formation